jgi:8-oxo-dGTP diphosphatase
MSSVYQHPAGDYILKNPGHTENYMVPRDIHRLGKAADRLEETYEDGLDTPEWWKSKLSVTAKDADTIADSLDYVAENPLPLMGLSVQVKGYRNTAGAFVMKGKKFLILQRSKKETSKHGLWELPGGKVEKGETPRETAVIETQEEAGLDVTLKVNLGPHIDDKKKKVYHAFIATPKKGQKVKLSFEHSDYKWVTPEEVMAMPKKMVSHHLMYFLKKEGEAIRSNPPKNKIEKGKKLYEHMNGKAPEKIEKKKIDMGDVWYQVGEGGCWQIGYMSGKETGKSEQKYTHTFNEETKDGNFPKLYATMPENGKPLLIIQGGTWKIRTDDKGVAWIYD